MLLASLGGVEYGNLYNAGYLALVTMIEIYDPRCQTCFYRLDGLGAAEVRESPPDEAARMGRPPKKPG